MADDSKDKEQDGNPGSLRESVISGNQGPAVIKDWNVYYSSSHLQATAKVASVAYYFVVTDLTLQIFSSDQKTLLVGCTNAPPKEEYTSLGAWCSTSVFNLNADGDTVYSVLSGNVSTSNGQIPFSYNKDFTLSGSSGSKPESE